MNWVKNKWNILSPKHLFKGWYQGKALFQCNQIGWLERDNTTIAPPTVMEDKLCCPTCRKIWNNELAQGVKKNA